MEVVSGTFMSCIRLIADATTGATFTVPILVDLAQKVKSGKARCKRIDFVLAVQHEGKSFPQDKQEEANDPA